MLPTIDLDELDLTPEQRELCADIIAYSDTAGRLRQACPCKERSSTQYIWWLVSYFATDRQHINPGHRHPIQARFLRFQMFSATPEDIRDTRDATMMIILQVHGNHLLETGRIL